MSRFQKWRQSYPRISKLGAALSLLMALVWIGRGIASTPESDDCTSSTMTATKGGSPDISVSGLYQVSDCSVSTDYKAYRDDDDDTYTVAGHYCCFEPATTDYNISNSASTTGLIGYIGQGESIGIGADCADSNSAINPGATETAADGTDSDCDSEEQCYQDADSDSYRTATLTNYTGLTAGGTGLCSTSGRAASTVAATDCADSVAAINPGATETAADGTDSNCDASEQCYQDADSDSYRTDTLTTYTVTAGSTTACTGSGKALSSVTATDCADSIAAINPGATETAADGTDSNCDASEQCYQDADGDSYRTATLTAYTVTAGSTTACTGSGKAASTVTATDCADSVSTINPGVSETAADGTDLNCDGVEQCYQDADGDSYRTDTLVSHTGLTAGGTGLCSTSGRASSSALATDCADSVSTINPGVSETAADGTDSNCDGTEQCYQDADSDSYRTATLTSYTGLTTGGTGLCSTSGRAASTVTATDCADSVAAINPGAAETVADGTDSNCDASEQCYQDADGDSYRTTTLTAYSVTAGSTTACTGSGKAASTVATTDCDDTDNGDYPGATEVCNSDDEDCDGIVDDGVTSTWYLDSDGDGYGVTGSTTLSCTLPSGYALLSGDCDDTATGANPGATETVGNGDDENCDGTEICYTDADNDGYRPTADPTLASTDTDCSDAGEALSSDGTGDCDDADNTENPGVAETAGNGEDDNCDGGETCYIDADNDGYRPNGTSTVASVDSDCADAGEAISTEPTTDCDDNSSGDNPGATETVGNGDDENCDGTEICYTDADNDGYRPTSDPTLASTDTDCSDAGEALSSDGTGDCDDADSTENPGVAETVGNGEDDNCDGGETCYVDADDDGYRPSTGTATTNSADSDCSDSGEAISTNPTNDCDDADSADNPGATETIGNSDDDNCDGAETCYLDDDNDGYRPSANPTATIASTDTDCSDTDEALSTDPTTDCDDGNSAVSPATVEVIADGVDQNCDNGDTCYNDDDDDGYLDTTGDTIASTDLDCSDANEGTGTDPTTDCDDNDVGDYPGAPEVVANGDDEDCDWQETCYFDDDNDGYRPNATSTIASTDGDCNDTDEALSTDPTTDCDDADAGDYPAAVETVGNEDDEDCDGFETCYADLDNDGYRTTSTFASTDVDCGDSQEALSSDSTGDCDDNDANDNPGATEIVGNSDDDNCDNGEICYDDDDDDGYLDGTGDTRVSADTDCGDAFEGLSTDLTTDCDDASSEDYPGATEIVGNGDDEDCDGFEGCYEDDDNDGYLDTSGDTRPSLDNDCLDANEGAIGDPTTDCDDNDDRDYPGAAETVANGDDEDCDGQEICYEDDDNDTYLDSSGDTRISADGDCSDANEGLNTDPTSDCDDADATTNPGQTEIVGFGGDNDCDGFETCYNDNDNDSYLDATADTITSADEDCDDAYEGTNTALTTDCDDADAGDYPGAVETYDNGDDEDCDGTESCYDDDDNDGFLDATGDIRYSTDMLCDGAFEGTISDPTTDCDDTDANDYPAAPETVNNNDDEDCDGYETCYDDDDDDGYLDATGDTRLSADLDCSDAYEGVPSDPTTDCDDFDINDNPGATETIDNGDDEDCDGFETCYDDDDDDGVLDASGDTIESTTDLDCLDAREGQPGDATDDCDDLDAGDYPGATEVVGNEDDEDCDGTEVCYLDADNDGYVPSLGATSETIPSTDIFCTEANEGTATDALLDPDCDDDDPDTYPGAAEIEDVYVNSGRGICMRDADHDGWGDDLASGDILAGTDCDDADATTRPRADDSNFERDTVARLTQDTDGDGTPDVDDTPPLIDYNGNNIHDWREVLTEDVNLVACYTDLDLDGYGDTDPADPGATPGSDCEDDPNSSGVQINPGEDEACEVVGTQIDTDCDGSSNTDWDGQSLGILPLYRDADDDGYGVIGGTEQNGGLTHGCSAGDGWSTLPIDCDDTLPQVNPSADESCNEKDDNCNGITDDPINGDPAGCSLLYLDYDEDGYGDLEFLTCLCDTDSSLGVGSEVYDDQTYVSVNTDCDDFDPDIHPVDPDCGDGLDNDGDGLSDLTDPDCGFSALCANGVDDDGNGETDDSDELAQCIISPCNNNFDDDGDGDVDEDDVDCDGACGQAGCFEDRRQFKEERIDGSDDDCDDDILAIEMDCDDDGAMPSIAERVPEADRSEVRTITDPAEIGLQPCTTTETIDITCWDGEDVQLSCELESGLWVANYTTSDDGWAGRFVGGRREYPAGRSDDAQVSFDCDDLCALRYGGATESCDGLDNDCNGFVGADADQDGLPSALDEDAGTGVESDRIGKVTESELDIDQDGFLSCSEFDADGAQLWPTDRSCSDQIVEAELLTDCNDQCALVFPGMESACEGFETVCDAEVLGVDEDRDQHQTCGAWAAEETDEHVYLMAALIGGTTAPDTGDTADTGDSAGSGATQFVPLILPRRRVAQGTGTVPIWYGTELEEGQTPEIEPCDEPLYDALHTLFAGIEVDGMNPVDKAIAENDPIWLAQACATSGTVTCGVIRIGLISSADEHLWSDSEETLYSIPWARANGVIEESCVAEDEELITRATWPAGRIRESRRMLTEWECYRVYGVACGEVPQQAQVTIPVPDTVGFSTALEADLRWWKEITRFAPTEVVSGTLRECWGDPAAASAITLSDVGGDCADGSTGASRDQPEGPGDLISLYNGDPAECAACLDGVDNNCDGQTDCDDPSCAPCFVGHGQGCAADGSPCEGAGCEAIPDDPVQRSTLLAGLGAIMMAAVRRSRKTGRSA